MVRGAKTTEFWLIVCALVFALAVGSGVITPEKVTQSTSKISRTTEAIPALIDAGKSLLESLGPLAGYLALVWAYLKRRSEQKLASSSTEKEVELITAKKEKDVALAELERLKRALIARRGAATLAKPGG